MHKHKMRVMKEAHMAKGGPHRGRGRGRGRRGVEPPAVTTAELTAWFAGSLPDGWFVEPPVIRVDRDEILVTGTLPLPHLEGSEELDESVAAGARIEAFREETREQRMSIAERAQQKFLRKVSWSVECGEFHQDFTTASVPVMTRLDIDQRATLDTLIDAGVARSRSEALAWCVQLVADNEADWIEKLRGAMEDLTKLRDEGPPSQQ